MTNEEKDRIFNEEFMPIIDALYNFAFHLTYNEATSNDLVQETYLKAYKFIGNYQEGTNAKAWLFRILKNAFINDFRRTKRKGTTVSVEDNYEAEITNTSDLRKEIFDNQIGDEITFALNKLPLKYKTIILLSDVEEFKYEEISEILEIPIGTVRSRLNRARNTLKLTLKDYAVTKGYKDKRRTSK